MRCALLGILVFMIGFNMLQGDSTHQKTKEKAYSPAQQQAALSIAVSPLAMPILAGRVRLRQR